MKLTKQTLRRIIKEEIAADDSSNDMKLHGTLEDGIKTLSHALSQLASGAVWMTHGKMKRHAANAPENRLGVLKGDAAGGEKQFIKTVANLAKELELLADGVGLQQEVRKAIREVEKFLKAQASYEYTPIPEN
jgi:hypothetical protein